MLHPSYTDLIEAVNSDVEPGEQPVVQSRYSIVIASAKRARQIIGGAEPLVPNAAGKKPLSIAIAMSDYILGHKGAYRVHGGGFGGTIQAVVPKELVNDYKMVLSSVCDKDSIMELVVRPFGTKTLI